MRQPYFFKVFLPNLSTGSLRIPTDFFKHLEGETSGTVSLIGPSGNTWNVELVKSNGGLFFQEGWPVFVKDHYIQIGDFLVFRYDGNLDFTVLIFDKSACEKEAAFCVNCSQDTTEFTKSAEKKRERKEAEEERKQRKTFDGVSKRKRGNSPQGHSDSMKMADTIQFFDKSSCKVEDTFILTAHQGSAFNGRKKQDRPSGWSVNFKDHQGHHLPFPKGNYVNIKAEAVTKKIKIENLNLPVNKLNAETRALTRNIIKREPSWIAASTFTSNFPYFIKCMTKHSLSKVQGIPVCFARAHFRSSNKEFVFRIPEGRSWIVKSSFYQEQLLNKKGLYKEHYYFSTGWLAFVCANRIEIGDTLIFEFVGKDEVCVHIFQ